MAIADDFSVAANGDIRYTGTTANYTVLELHQFLAALADDASAGGDDLVDITSPTPSNRQVDTIIELLGNYNVDDAAVEHLYEGSIIQAGGDTRWDGITNFGNATHIEILQNGALIANDFWNAGGGINADSGAGISHRFMVKVRDSGADIDGRRLLGLTREFGKDYREFPINGTQPGVNVLALSASDDLNNQTAIGTIAGYTDITNVEGYQQIDVTGDTVDEPYYSQWDRGSRTINDLYERVKWITRRGTSETIYGLNGGIFRGITHEIDIDTNTGTFQEPEAVSWSGGTGQLLAIDSTTAGTKMWIQLLTGVVPTDGQTITGGTSSATAAVNVTVTSRDVPQVVLGNSTGSSIIGAFGVGVQVLDLSASDTLTDLTNTAQNPPNNVVFTVAGLVATEDSVLVGPEDGSGGLDLDQLSVSGNLTGASVTSVTTGTAIPSDTPASGTVRILADDGRYLRVPYDSFSGSTFTIPSFDFSGSNNVTTGNNLFISYIDKVATATTEQFGVTFDAPRTLFVRIRDGGGTPIKPFEATSTLGAGGGSITAIRTSDA